MSYNKQEKETKAKYKEVSLFRNPLTTSYYLFGILKDLLIRSVRFYLSSYVLIISNLAYVALSFFSGPHTPYLLEFNKVVYFGLYWILLGVASSVGLGTGLHTFVLYLGPHIVKIILAANECAYFPVMHPSKWDFHDFLPCTEASTDLKSVSFWTILLSVQLESFLWGFGTALGELPPYFMAKAATEAGKDNEELEELREIEEHTKENENLIEKIKCLIYEHLKRHGFITVLICASVPNPLFDLAGITCGHFLIPFGVFFGATFIGKSIIKVNIQVVFIIIIFSKHHMENFLFYIENHIPYFKGSLTVAMEKQKQMLWYKNDETHAVHSKPWIAVVWEVLITLMLAYFLLSIINTLVNDRRKKEFSKNKQD